MAPAVSLPPGFRFHPTDEELVGYYLNRKINGRTIELEVIPEVDLYKCEPWDLPAKSLLPSKDLEWYFFSPRDRKYPNGSRTNRATRAGYWKATGKDRNVDSQRRAVGMKKTLVYYIGRAPHGTRTDWVMHEYKLDERQCETASSLQDAYALCRIFKKSLNAPKAADRNGITASDYSISSNNEIYSQRLSRCQDYIESSDHHPILPFQTYPPNNNNLVMHGSPQKNGCGTSNDSKWMQYLSEDAFSYNNPSFPHCKTISYPPSKVDIAVECGRMEHRLALPPLQVQDFPQTGFVDMKMQATSSVYGNTSDYNQQDVLNEILAVAQVSQELMDQNSWLGKDDDDFSFLPNNYQNQGMDSGIMSIEIDDLDEQFNSDQRMLENLRWVEKSNRDLHHKSFMDEYKTSPMEKLSNFQIEEHEVQDQGNDDFLLGFVNEEPDDYSFLDADDLDDFSTTPSFELVNEQIEINHGLLVSTHQVPKTFFHQVVPSETVKVHLNLVTSRNISQPTTWSKKYKTLLDKVKDFAALKLDGVVGKSLKPLKNMESPVGLIALILTYFIYTRDYPDNYDKLREGDDKIRNFKWVDMEIHENMRCDLMGMKKVGLVGMVEYWNSSIVLNKLWSCVALALAIFHHLGSVQFIWPN